MLCIAAKCGGGVCFEVDFGVAMSSFLRICPDSSWACGYRQQDLSLIQAFLVHSVWAGI
jgi:hypothetical protein